MAPPRNRTLSGGSIFSHRSIDYVPDLRRISEASSTHQQPSNRQRHISLTRRVSAITLETFNYDTSDKVVNKTKQVSGYMPMIVKIGYTRLSTTLLSMMNAKLSQQAFCPCHENRLIKTIQMILTPQPKCDF